MTIQDACSLTALHRLALTLRSYARPALISHSVQDWVEAGEQPPRARQAAADRGLRRLSRLPWSMRMAARSASGDTSGPMEDEAG